MLTELHKSFLMVNLKYHQLQNTDLHQKKKQKLNKLFEILIAQNTT